MKTSRKLLTLAASMFAFAAIMTPHAAMAVLTPPCTPISNQADLTYSVGSVLQPVVKSDDDGTIPGTGAEPTTFNVGIKIVVNVSNNDTDNMSITPSTTLSAINNALKFTVTNSGNATHDYFLQAINEASDTGLTVVSPHGGFDAFSPTATNIKLYLESNTVADLQVDGATPDTLMSGLSPANTIQDLDPTTGSKIVYLHYLPNDLMEEDTKVAVYYLKATTRWADGTALDGSITVDGNERILVSNAEAGIGTCGADTMVDVVLGDEIDAKDLPGPGPGSIAGTGLTDAARNGASIDDSAFIVETPKLKIIKTKVNYSDPVNGAGLNAKEIPEAVVTYIITILNEGSADATNVTFDDDLSTQITKIDFGNLDTNATYGSSNGSFRDATNNCTAAAGQGIVVTDGVAAETATCMTNIDTDDEGTIAAQWKDDKVTVTGLTIDQGETATIKLQVTIK